jgi:hypothetical protein
MTAAEQQFVMDEIARLERGGRVEALRELRDHYHVFAFPGGVRPDDGLVDKVLKGRARDADDPKQKAATARAKDSKEKMPARETKAASARGSARDKKGARRR